MSRAIVVLALVTVAGCGGDDPEPTGDPAGDQVTMESGSAGTDVLAENASRDTVLDAVGGTDGGVDDAIAGLSAEQRYGIVAGRLDPEPDVEIDGREVRLVFDGGSVSDAVMDCILATAIQRADETVTLVYADGDETC
jgi:hypothetical protein